jgi:transaldolase
MQLPSNIYIDGGDPAETKEADSMLKKAGYHGLDGQTTNPSLIAKNFSTKNGGKKISLADAFGEYKRVVTEMSKIIPEGKISIQVIGDPATLTTEEMISQARDRIRWIPNGVIKFPCTTAGLAAVEVFCQEGPVNITLNFSQEQAAAVYAATIAHNYDVFISPFVGRLDDKGENGMDVVVNELEMFKAFGDHHVNTLAASIRSVKHFMYSLWLKTPVITVPFKVLKEWVDGGCVLPPQEYIYDTPGLTEIPYREITLDKDWKEYDLHHDLTDAGVAKFWEDWKSIVE